MYIRVPGDSCQGPSLCTFGGLCRPNLQGLLSPPREVSITYPEFPTPEFSSGRELSPDSPPYSGEIAGWLIIGVDGYLGAGRVSFDGLVGNGAI
jgi:hypothetical protein